MPMGCRHKAGMEIKLNKYTRRISLRYFMFGNHVSQQ